MTTKKLLKLEDIVKPILEESIAARNDDFYLYYKVLEVINPRVNDFCLSTVLISHNDLNMPSYESVSRVRRKIQAKCPELASERVKKRRMKEIETYKEYAKIN